MSVVARSFRRWLPCALLMAGALTATNVAGQTPSYPQKTIRIICPTAPGGGTDLLARLLAQKLNEALGQPVVVDNRGGAGTTIGAQLAAQSPADGYTLLVHHTSLAFNESYYRELPYAALRDFAPVALLAAQPFIVIVHPSLPVHTVRELIALAKARAGQLRYSSGGAGSGPFMAMELLKLSTRIDIVHVPYKGAGPALTDLIAGQVQTMIGTVSLTLPHARTGRVRALAVTGDKRLAVAPDLPTVAEAGVAGYDFETWYGLFVPARTSSAIVSRLNTEAVGIVQATDFRQRLAAEGLEPRGSTVQAFAGLLASEIAKWRKVVNAARLTADTGG